MENPPAEPTISTPHEETKGPKLMLDHPLNDFLEIAKTKAGNQTNLLTNPNPTGTTLPNKAESLMLNAIAAVSTAEAKRAERLIKNGNRITGKKGMIPEANPATGSKTVSDKNVLTVPSHPITVLIQTDAGDLIRGSLPTEGLTRTDPTTRGGESLLLARVTRREAKAPQSQNGLPTVLAVSGKTSLTPKKPMKTVTPREVPKNRLSTKGTPAGLIPKTRRSKRGK